MALNLELGQVVEIVDPVYLQRNRIEPGAKGNVVDLGGHDEFYKVPTATIELLDQSGHCLGWRVAVWEGICKVVPAPTKATTPTPTSTPTPHLPTGAEDRKKVPLWSGLVQYFPDALVAVAQLSQKGNDQHNGVGAALHWDRTKSSDHKDTLLRHLFDSGTLDADGVPHSVKVAWRSLAALQIEIEASKSSPK